MPRACPVALMVAVQCSESVGMYQLADGLQCSPGAPCNDEPCCCLSDRTHSTLPSSAFVSITHSSSVCFYLSSSTRVCLFSHRMPHTLSLFQSVPLVSIGPQERLRLYLQSSCMRVHVQPSDAVLVARLRESQDCTDITVRCVNYRPPLDASRQFPSPKVCHKVLTVV